MSTFFNPNVTKMYNQLVDTNITALTGQVCSEVTVTNRTSVSIYLYSNGLTASNCRMLIPKDESFTLRGVTDASEVSAQTVSSSGTIYYTTNYFSAYGV